MSLFQTLTDLTRRGPVERASHFIADGCHRILSGARSWLAAKRAVTILEPYRRSATLKTYFTATLALFALGLFCVIYGFYFGLMAPYLFVMFLAPIALIAMLAIWALPDLRTAPTYGLEVLFPATLIVTLLWPDYVAIALPGLPWITLLRLVNFPLVGLLLVCLSVSSAFREELARTCRETRHLWMFLGAFTLTQIISLGLSKSTVGSAQLVALFHITCTTPMIIAALTLREQRHIERLLGLLCAMGFILCVIAIFESMRQHVLWASHIPSFLRIQDPSVARTLAASFRMYLNKYRAKATFRTPLALAEYISLLTPFLLHFALTPRKLLIRIASGATIPLIFYVVRLTDSRLGVVGMLVSVLLYGGLASVVWRQKHPQNLLSAAMLYATPVFLCGAVGIVLASHRLSSMVFGGGAQAGSTEARNTQLSMALPSVWANPLGYGAGQSGGKMGFGPDEAITIDNYFISLILDYGILGVALWYAMFICAIYWSVRYALSPRYIHRPEAQWLVPLGVCLTAFLVIKWVHGQTDSHAILFSLLGMVAAIVYKLRTSDEARSPSGLISTTVAPQRSRAAAPR